MDTLRILVADDEAGMRHSITRALGNYTARLPEVEAEVRFAVDSVASGEEAVARLESDPPDILLLDYKMNGMTGLEVLERLAQRPRDMLTVMITAFATIETAVRATKCGAFDFIAKPFTPEDLKDTVRKVAAHLLLQRRASRLLEEKRRVRFEFIRVLGHELKAPLAAIESYLAILKDRTLGGDVQAYDHMIQRCLIRCEGMRKLILDLLDMTRIESGERKRELGSVDVAAVARACLEGAAVAAAARNLDVRLTADGDLLMTADPTELEVVLNNLISNAVKYNRDGGRVEVRLCGDERSIIIEVQDTGIGLTEAEASTLFHDFARVRNQKTRDIAGSGLGLSVVKKIAQLYEGTVSVVSRADEGSTFHVELQRNTAPAANVAAAAAPGPAGEGSDRKP